MDRDGAAREGGVRAGLLCNVHGVPVEAFAWMRRRATRGARAVLSEVQLAETMPTYIESHRSCCARNDKQVLGA